MICPWHQNVPKMLAREFLLAKLMEKLPVLRLNTSWRVYMFGLAWSICGMESAETLR